MRTHIYLFALSNLQLARANFSAALCFFGKVGNLRGGSRNFASDLLSSRLAYPSQRRHLIEVNERRGWRTDVFVHSPDVQFQEQIRATYKPLSASFQPDPEFELITDATKGESFHELKLRAFGHSVHQVASLVGAAERQNGVAYDLIVMMRLDILFYKDLLLPGMDTIDEGWIWLGAWCEPRGKDSRTYGRGIPKRDRCGRLHASTMHHLGVPDYMFLGRSETMVRFAAWGPGIDRTFNSLLKDHGPDAAWMMLRGGGHTMIRAHLNSERIHVFHMPDIVEGIDYTVARRADCRLVVDWAEAQTSVGLACQHLMFNGRCDVDAIDPIAERVCPWEGRKVCVGLHRTHVLNFTLRDWISHSWI